MFLFRWGNELKGKTFIVISMTTNLVITDAVRKELREIVFTAVDDALNARKAKDSLLKTEDVMQAYGVSRTTLWRMVKAGTIHAIQGRGRQKLFSADECRNVLTRPIDN